MQTNPTSKSESRSPWWFSSLRKTSKGKDNKRDVLIIPDETTTLLRQKISGITTSNTNLKNKAIEKSEFNSLAAVVENLYQLILFNERKDKQLQHFYLIEIKNEAEKVIYSVGETLTQEKVCKGKGFYVKEKSKEISTLRDGYKLIKQVKVKNYSTDHVIPQFYQDLTDSLNEKLAYGTQPRRDQLKKERRHTIADQLQRY